MRAVPALIGALFVGPPPPALQNYTRYVAVVTKNAPNAKEAAALVACFASADGEGLLGDAAQIAGGAGDPQTMNQHEVEAPKALTADARGRAG
jgi:hypothetical protein